MADPGTRPQIQPPPVKETETSGYKLKDTVYFSRLAFLFVIFTVVSSGYIAEILSCQMRYVFENSLYFRHFVGILMVFVFIMMEGGWSFDQEVDDEAPNNWASGNVLHTTVMAFVIYLVFLISSKSRFWPNIIFFSLLLILYFMNTQREYYLVRKRLDEKTNEILLGTQYGITAITIGVLVYGFVDYIFYQMKEHPTDFDWLKFLLGGHQCKSLMNSNVSATTVNNNINRIVNGITSNRRGNNAGSI